jgi:hypothetical protein
MDSTKVASLLARIPQRVARAVSGTPFSLPASRCAEPDRFARLCGLLQWLTPLELLSKDDQRVLALFSSNARAVDALVGNDDAELEVEEPVA